MQLPAPFFPASRGSCPSSHPMVWPLGLRSLGGFVGLLAAGRAAKLLQRPCRRSLLARRTANVNARIEHFYQNGNADEEDAYAGMCSELEGASDFDEICELTGWDLEEQAYYDMLDQPMSKPNRLKAWHRCGYFSATPDLEHPVAVWVIGPSAAGKLTVSKQKAHEFGLDKQGWVLVDGQFFHEQHPGFTAAKKDGKTRGCVWWGVYSKLKAMFDAQKERLIQAATRKRKNIIIPHQCLDAEMCLKSIRKLKSCGYTCHVVGVYGDRLTLMQRGRRRALEQGIRYEPREFDLSMQSMEPMMGEANGIRQLVVTTSPGRPRRERRGRLHRGGAARGGGSSPPVYEGQMILTGVDHD